MCEEHFESNGMRSGAWGGFVMPHNRVEGFLKVSLNWAHLLDSDRTGAGSL